MTDSLRVLVIDEAGDVRDGLCRTVSGLGLWCEAVVTVRDAYMMLDWWRPVVVVVDPAHAPGLAAQLRAWSDDRLRRVLVVGWCARASEHGEHFDAELAKPGSVAEITELFARLAPLVPGLA